MSLNTLETSYVNGQVVDASHINELTLSLLGQFVGRDSNGVPTPSQSLGTLAIPWGNLYAEGVILNGLALDVSQITALPNRIVSGKTRSLSGQPDFLRALGSSLEVNILGASTDLILSINNNAVSVSSDLLKSGLSPAPSTNNTADINDTAILNDLYAGEEDASINELTIDAVGSEITSLVGELVAFKTPTGEIFKGYLKSTTKITNVFRGFYFDSSGNPIVRGNLSNNDTITLMKLGWLFLEDNGTTIDVTYKTPSISYEAPNSPSTGDYWYDISNQVWKRYSGASWEIINRILIGEFVSDDTNTIASRSYDFSNSFDNFNNIETQIDSTEIVSTKSFNSRCNVYGTQVEINETQVKWNITTDLETGLIEASDTLYYLYVSTNGQSIISDKRPYLRHDLKGYYHPYHNYRCIGAVYNDVSNDLILTDNTLFNTVMKEKIVLLEDRKTSGVGGGNTAASTTTTRDLNYISNSTLFTRLNSNQFSLIEGVYKLEGSCPAFQVDQHQAFIYNLTTSNYDADGSGEYIETGNMIGTNRSFIDSILVVKKYGLFELRHFTSDSITNGFGVPTGTGSSPQNHEKYSSLKITKIK